VHSVQDIIEEFQPGTMGCEAREGELHADTEKVADLDPDEAALFALLDVYPLTIDEIARISGFSPQRTSELLLLLELKGLVESLPGKNYKRSKDFTR
jgi:DNA processing protein